MKYFDECKRGMEYLATKANTLFLGQAVKFKGTAGTRLLADIPDNKKIELPVAEEMQLGICNGLALRGYVPVSIYPRYNFLLLAMNQLVNHLDKFNIISNGEINPKVIIKVVSGSKKPLHPGHQHIGDFSDGLRTILTNVDVVQIKTADEAFKAHVDAYNNKRSTILVEYGDLYG